MLMDMDLSEYKRLGIARMPEPHGGRVSHPLVTVYRHRETRELVAIKLDEERLYRQTVWPVEWNELIIEPGAFSESE